MKGKFWKFLLPLVILTMIASGLTACATPTPQVIREVVTQVVEVEKEVTRVVAGTPVVETVVETKVVEKEVTVEVEKVVTATPEPVEETQIIIGVLGEAETLNPIIANQSESGWRAMMLFDPLVELDMVTFEPVGRLATHWDISDDGLTYTFYLRKDAKWHDGEPVTAEDVEFAVLAIMSPDYTGPNYSRWDGIVGVEEVHEGKATECEGVKVIDDYTISFTLKEPNAPFLVDSLASDIPLIPLPKHILEGQNIMDNDFNLAPVGNGPYKFVSWEIGGDFVMEANPDWWGGEPKINKVIHRVIADSQTLVVALEAGEIEGSLYGLPTVADRLREKEDLRVKVVAFDFPNGAYDYNFSHPVLKDMAVRQAIAHAVDTITFADEFLLGLGKAGVGCVAPSNWAFNKNIKMHEYDPELSRQLLDEAGWVDTDGDGIREKDGVPAVIVAETNAGNVMREDFCTYTQASVKEIGIDWKCEFKEWSVIVDDVNTGNFEALMPTWSGASVEPHELYRGFHTKGSNNVRGYSNPEVDALLEEGRVTVDLARRKEIYDKVQEIIHEELPVWYAWYRPYISVIDAKFDGPWFKTSYLYGGCFRNLFEWDVAQ